MVDYVAVLKKAIDTLPRNTPELRARIYAKARQTVESKLDLVKPAPSEAMREKQLTALDDAVETLEAEYSAAAAESAAATKLVVEKAEPVEQIPEPESEPAPELKNLEPVKAEMPSPVQEYAPEAVEEIAENNHADLPPNEYVQDKPAEPELIVDHDTIGKPDDGLQPDPGYDDFTHSSSVNEEDERDAFFDDVFGVQTGSGSDEQIDDASHSVPISSSSRTSLDDVVIPPVTRKKSGSGKAILLGLIGAIIVGGGGYLVYQERDTIMSVLQGSGGTQTSGEPQTGDAPATTEVPATEPADAAAVDTSTKFNQRLTVDGLEVDGGSSSAGGVQSVAQLEPGSQKPLAESGQASTNSGTAAPQTAIAVGEQAIFYEERTSAEQGTAKTGAVVWRLVQESPGNDLPPEAAVRGELSIPENNVVVRMTLRRNADDTLPASHIWELVVDAPPEFAGGGIEEIQRINMKPSEAAPGQPLVAVPVKIADGFFLIALDSEPSVEKVNVDLLSQLDWIDIPVVYRTGRRALFTMEKGLTGQKVFNDALTAWGQKPS